MKYDLIVIGGGPAGLMAAKTAAEDGLRVILIERKRNITEINRACVQIFYLLKKHPVSGQTRSDGYIDPVSVECEANKTRFHFPVPGFSIDYHGCLRPYLNWLHLSPSGNIVYRYEMNERPWGFYVHKEAFVAELLDSAEKAGAEVRAETLGLGAKNTRDGVSVRIKTKSGEETLEASTAIAADGNGSRIVESLGLNETRKMFRRWGVLGIVNYILEGVETSLPDSAWLTWAIPSINNHSNIWLGMWAENRHVLGTVAIDAAGILNKFMNDDRYAHMFRRAWLVKKEAYNVGRLPAPLREPVVGNTVIIGDAGSPSETWVQGAVACGYQAVKAIEKELNEQKGYPEYIAWWQQAFAFNFPAYINMAPNIYTLPQVCSDEEVDYLYSLVHNKIGSPLALVNDNIELVKSRRLELYEKLVKSKS
jgi:flavin-dependent dehydrogenase